MSTCFLTTFSVVAGCFDESTDGHSRVGFDGLAGFDFLFFLSVFFLTLQLGRFNLSFTFPCLGGWYPSLQSPFLKASLLQSPFKDEQGFSAVIALFEASTSFTNVQHLWILISVALGYVLLNFLTNFVLINCSSLSV